MRARIREYDNDNDDDDDNNDDFLYYYSGLCAEIWITEKKDVYSGRDNYVNEYGMRLVMQTIAGQHWPIIRTIQKCLLQYMGFSF